MEREEWRDIPSISGYQASNLGRIRRVVPDQMNRFAGRVLSQASNNGYLRVQITHSSGKRQSVLVHRLVCEAFHGRMPPDKSHCAHIDGTRSNNRPSNLYWATPRENAADRNSHGTTARGDQHWTRRHPEKVLRGKSHPRSAPGYKAPCGDMVGTCKLSEDQVREIRSTPQLRGTGKMLAEHYGVSMGLISAIRKGRIWRHIT
jgi:hypothetical protein